MTPALDSIQEFRIETVGSSAQYSRPASVTLVTRSGTNALHGSVFETHRNNAAGLRARQIQDGATSPKYIRNEFGASAGGPIINDKTFWFGAYEGFRLRQARFVQSIVPTDAIWAGDFNSLVDSSGNSYRIFDPLTTAANGVRQQFPNNRIPADRIHSFYKKLQTLSATPTNSINPSLGNNFLKFYPATRRSRHVHRQSRSQTVKQRQPVRQILSQQAEFYGRRRSLRLSCREPRRSLWDRA